MPRIAYKKLDGTKVKGVTTILDALGWNKGALMGWANKGGRDGKTMRELRDQPLTVGTLAHAMIAADICNPEPCPEVTPEAIAEDLDMELGEGWAEQAQRAFDAWKEWRSRNEIEIVASEKSMVSEIHGYGGTTDLVFKSHGKLGVLDFKAAASLYSESLVQIRAYGELWRETYNTEPEIYAILRLGKEDASFHYHEWSADSETMQAALTVFRALLEIDKCKTALKV